MATVSIIGIWLVYGYQLSPLASLRHIFCWFLVLRVVFIVGTVHLLKRKERAVK